MFSTISKCLAFDHSQDSRVAFVSSSNVDTGAEVVAAFAEPDVTLGPKEEADVAATPQ